MKAARRPRILGTSVAALLALVVSGSTPSKATQLNWTGGVDGNWETNANTAGPTNWFAPVPAAGFTSTNMTPFSDVNDSDLHFGSGPAILTPFNDNAGANITDLQSIAFDAGASAYTLSGNAIQMDGGGNITGGGYSIINNSSNTQTLAFTTSGASGITGIQLTDVNFNNSTTSPLINWTANTAALVINSNVLFIAPITLTFNGAQNVTITGNMTELGGTGSLVVSGGGTVLLSGTNSLSGTTTISNGTIQLGADNAISTTGLLTINSTDGSTQGVLDLNGHNQTIGSLTVVASGSATSTIIGAGTLTLNGDINFVNDTNAPGHDNGTTIAAGTLALSAGNHNFNVAGQNVGQQELTITSAITGAGGITINATPSTTQNTAAGVVFSGPGNTYTGTTIVNDGYLTLNGGAGTIEIAGNVVIGDNIGDSLGLANTARVILSGGGNQIATTSNMTINSDGLFDMGGFSQTITNLTINSGNVNNVPTGGAGNSLTLLGSLNMTGGTINGGTGSTPGLVLAGGAGVSDVTATSDASGNAATINSNVTLDSGGSVTRTFTVNAGGGPIDLNITGIIQNGAGSDSIVKAGNGVMVLSNAGNTYTGTTTVSAGILQIGTAAAGGSVSAANIAVTTGGTLAVVNIGGPTANTLANNISNGVGGVGTVNVNSANNTTLSGVLSDGAAGTLALTQSGASTTFLTGTNTYSGTTTISAGTLQVGGSTAGGTATGTLGSGAVVDNSNLNLNRNGASTLVVANQISGTGTVNQNGSGTTLFGGAAANTYTGATAIQAGVLGIGSTGAFGTVASHTSSVTVSSGAALDLNGTNLVAPAQLNLNGPGLGAIGALGNSSATNTAATYLGPVLLQSSSSIGSSNGDITLTNTVSGAAGANLTKIGTDTLFLAGNNTYAGTTTISGGTLQIGNAGTSGTLGTGSVTDNATLAFNRTDSITVSNVISGTGVLNQNGTGTVILNGADTYTGATNVTAGTLQVGDGTNGSIAAASPVSVNAGAALAINLATGGTFGNTVAEAGSVNVIASGTNTLSGVISGAGVLNQNGTGTTILTGANAYNGATNVTLGTLQIGNGATGSIGAVSPVTVSAGATLAINLATGSTFANTVADTGSVNAIAAGTNTLSGVISGAGVLNQNGTGTTILTGANTYTGATTINAGTLQIGNGGTAGNLGTGAVVDNAILAFNRTDTVIVSNAISGTGAVNQNGTGTTVLTGANTYSGTTTIAAGTLQVGNGGTSGNLGTGGVINNGTLAFNRTDTLSVANIISGTGAVNQNGTGTAILTATNTYTGATNVNAGTLQVGNGTSGNLTGTSGVTVASNSVLVTNLAAGSTFSPNVNLNGATAAFNAIQSGNNTIASLISGTGVFNQNGTGTTILTAANTYSGATTINAGALEVNGSIANSATAVTSLGTLQGIGTVGSVVNNGTVAPGSTAGGPGTLTVSGNYTQGSGGNLRIGLVSTSTFGRLAVNGSASLNGSVTAYSVGSFTPVVGNSFQVVNASGGVSGTFSNVVDQTHNAGTLVKLQAVYSPMAVTLQYVQGAIPIPPSSGGGSGGSNSGPSGIPGFGDFTGNEIAIAKVINGDLNDSRFRALLKYLDKLPLGSLPAALDRISPEELSSLATASTALADTQVQNIQTRIDALIAGSSGFTAQGMHLAGSGPNYAGSFSGSGLEGPNGADGKDSKDSKEAPPYNPRLGTFITGAGEWVTVGDTNNARGYDLITGGFTLGVDYKLTDNLAVGIDAGYAHTGIDLENGGRSSIDAGDVGLYGTYFTGGFYADGAVTGTYSGYDNRRAGLQGDAYGQTHSGAIDTLFATGYNFHVGGLTVGPTGSFHYNYTQIKDYSERGSLAPMSYPTEGVDSIRTAFGAKATFDWHVGGVLIRPELSLAWQHEYGENTPGVVAQFASGAGNQFTVFGPEYGRDSLLFGTGFAVLWNERFSSYFYYDGEFGRTNYDLSSISGGLRLTF